MYDVGAGDSSTTFNVQLASAPFEFALFALADLTWLVQDCML
jgi:hypothetical protein